LFQYTNLDKLYFLAYLPSQSQSRYSRKPLEPSTTSHPLEHVLHGLAPVLPPSCMLWLYMCAIAKLANHEQVWRQRNNTKGS